MARVVPELDDLQLANVRSRAEQRFYLAARAQLPNDWLVIFSTAWVGMTPGGRRYDGEADFVVVVPGSGLLVVEVKGGGVAFEPGRGGWVSIDATGTRHSIKDPFRQAVTEKYAIRDILGRERGWRAAHPGLLVLGHAVFLADVHDVAGLLSPESPREILGGRRDLERLQAWVRDVLSFWEGQGGGWMPLDRAGLRQVEEVLCGRLEARPVLRARLDSEEEVRLSLTRQQSRVLRALGTRRRAAICGGAGTGKTVLAVELARRLASEGKETLVLCYNHLLADFLKLACTGVERVSAMTFHQLCDWRVAVARERSGRDLLAEAKAAWPATSGSSLWDRQKPYALALACEAVPDRYDAVIVDEGQDFKEEYWLPVEWLLRDGEQSCLYVFYDQNQCLYTNASTFPIADPPFVLSFNCRNTRAIHDLAYRYFEGEATDGAPENPGAPVEWVAAPSLQTQAEAVHHAIVRLLTREDVGPGRVAVLLCGQPKESYHAALCSRPLPRGVRWEVEAPARCGGVRVDTVRRYKGLESDVVFLWGPDTASVHDERELLYVGLSRAKSHLVVVSTQGTCARLRPPAGD